MTHIALAIFVAYLALILISLLLDPKSNKSIAKRIRSIFHMVLFATAKMLIAIAVVIIGVLVCKANILQVLGLRYLSLNWKAVGLGVIAAFGFLAISIAWQLVCSRCSAKRTESVRGQSFLIDLLPPRWSRMMLVFLMISLEAGLLEELFFRGIMQSHFVSLFGVFYAVLAAGFLFGFAHFYQGFSGVIGTTLLGLWLGGSYALTGNLVVPILGHFLGDFACMGLSGRNIVKYKREVSKT